MTVHNRQRGTHFPARLALLYGVVVNYTRPISAEGTGLVTRTFLVLALLFPVMGQVVAQSTKNDCGRPPKIILKPQFSDDDQQKWEGKSIRGRVAIVVDENGDVTEARLISASPKEAGEAMVNAAKHAKFQSRSGCGALKTEIFFGPKN